MISLSKKFVLIIIFILVALGLLVESCVAPVTTPTKPSVGPEIVSITVYSNHFWDPPQYTTHPYTGETTETRPGRYLPYGTIDIKIKNQPFTPYTDKNGNTINIYYSFYMHHTDPHPSGHDLDSVWRYQLKTHGPRYSVYQSDSDYTL